MAYGLKVSSCHPLNFAQNIVYLFISLRYLQQKETIYNSFRKVGKAIKIKRMSKIWFGMDTTNNIHSVLLKISSHL